MNKILINKKTPLAFIVALFLFSQTPAFAQDSLQVKNRSRGQHKSQMKAKHGPGFVDLNGDGINDNAPDDDGDGIPNGMDPDYSGPRNGRGHGFIDENGDGINDFIQDFDGDGVPNSRDPDYRNNMKKHNGRRSHFIRRNAMTGRGSGSSGRKNGRGRNNRPAR
jgi:hypothetical protein